MPTSRSTNTMAETLMRILGDITQAKTLPDADLEFLVNLETQIIQKIREPYDMQGAGGPGMMPGPGAPTPMPGPAPAPGAAAPMGMPGGAPAGLRMEAPMPNPDELRRMVSA